MRTLPEVAVCVSFDWDGKRSKGASPVVVGKSMSNTIAAVSLVLAAFFVTPSCAHQNPVLLRLMSEDAQVARDTKKEILAMGKPQQIRLLREGMRPRGLRVLVNPPIR